MNKNILFIGLYIFAACHSNSKGLPIPSFNVLLLDSSNRLNISKLDIDRPFVLIFFSPDCTHCQKATESILHSMNSLKEIRFFFITNDEFSRLKVFNNYYKIYNYSNITLCQDDSFAFIRLYKNPMYPYAVLYDKHKDLQAVFKGEINGTQLVSLIKNM